MNKARLLELIKKYEEIKGADRKSKAILELVKFTHKLTDNSEITGDKLAELKKIIESKKGNSNTANIFWIIQNELLSSIISGSEAVSSPRSINEIDKIVGNYCKGIRESYNTFNLDGLLFNLKALIKCDLTQVSIPSEIFACCMGIIKDDRNRFNNFQIEIQNKLFMLLHMACLGLLARKNFIVLNSELQAEDDSIINKMKKLIDKSNNAKGFRSQFIFQLSCISAILGLLNSDEGTQLAKYGKQILITATSFFGVGESQAGELANEAFNYLLTIAKKDFDSNWLIKVLLLCHEGNHPVSKVQILSILEKHGALLESSIGINWEVPYAYIELLQVYFVKVKNSSHLSKEDKADLHLLLLNGGQNNITSKGILAGLKFKRPLFKNDSYIRDKALCICIDILSQQELYDLNVIKYIKENTENCARDSDKLISETFWSRPETIRNILKKEAEEKEKETINDELTSQLLIRYKSYQSFSRLFDDKQVDMDSSFINVRLQKNKENNNSSILDKNVKSIDPNVKDQKEPIVYEPLELTQLFEDKNTLIRKVLIQGKAGIGKSIICDYLVSQWAKGKENRAKLSSPDDSIKENNISAVGQYLIKKFSVIFLIKLRELLSYAPLTHKSPQLVDVIIKHCLGEIQQSKMLPESLNNYLADNKERILIIIDGYDEIVDFLHEPSYVYLKNIIDEIAEYPFVLMTSRPVGVKTLGAYSVKFDRVTEATGFNNDNIEKFIQEFMTQYISPCMSDGSSLPINNQHHSAKNLIQFLKAKPGIWDLVHTPINLELLSWLWVNEGIDFNDEQKVTLTYLYSLIVERITQLYAKRLDNNSDHLYHRQAPIPNDNFEGGPSILPNIFFNTINCFLASLGYLAMGQSSPILMPKLVNEALDKTIQVMGYENTINTRTNLLTAASHKIGFLRSLGGGKEPLDQRYEFIHLSFQEFFSARYIATHLVHDVNSLVSEEALKKIQEEKHLQRTHLTIKLVAGLLFQHGKKTHDIQSSKQFLPLLYFWKSMFSQPIDATGTHLFALIMQCLDECEGDETIRVHQAIYEKLKIYLEYRDLDVNSGLNPWDLQEAWYQSKFLHTKSMKNFLSQMINNDSEEIDDRVNYRAIIAELADRRFIIANRWLSMTLLSNNNTLQELEIDKKRETILQLLYDELKHSPSSTIKLLQKILKEAPENISLIEEDIFEKTKKYLPEIYPTLIKLSKHNDEEVPWRAMFLHGFYNPSGFDIFMSYSQDGSSEEQLESRYWSVKMVRYLILDSKDSTVKVNNFLLSIANNENENFRIRRKALLGLCAIPHPNIEMIKTILDALRSENIEFRWAALKGLRYQPHLSPEFAQVFFETLRGENDFDIGLTCQTLGLNADNNIHIYNEIIHAVKSFNNTLRVNAIMALDFMKNFTKDMMQVLNDLTKDYEKCVSNAAIKVLINKCLVNEEFFSCDISELLFEVIDNKNHDRRDSAIKLLGLHIHANQKNVTNKLLELVKNENNVLSDCDRVARASLYQVINSQKFAKMHEDIIIADIKSEHYYNIRELMFKNLTNEEHVKYLISLIAPYPAVVRDLMDYYIRNKSNIVINVQLATIYIKTVTHTYDIKLKNPVEVEILHYESLQYRFSFFEYCKVMLVLIKLEIQQDLVSNVLDWLNDAHGINQENSKFKELANLPNGVSYIKDFIHLYELKLASNAIPVISAGLMINHSKLGILYSLLGNKKQSNFHYTEALNAYKWHQELTAELPEASLMFSLRDRELLAKWRCDSANMKYKPSGITFFQNNTRQSVVFKENTISESKDISNKQRCNIQ